MVDVYALRFLQELEPSLCVDTLVKLARFSYAVWSDLLRISVFPEIHSFANNLVVVFCQPTSVSVNDRLTWTLRIKGERRRTAGHAFDGYIAKRFMSKGKQREKGITVSVDKLIDGNLA